MCCIQASGLVDFPADSAAAASAAAAAVAAATTTTAAAGLRLRTVGALRSSDKKWV